MSAYIYENPWPLILILCGVVVVTFMTGSSKTGPVAVACLLLSIGLYLLAGYLESPREVVQNEVYRMLDNFKARDLDAISAQIAPESEQLNDVAKRGLEVVELGRSFHMKPPKVTLDDSTTATALVRANGFVSLRGRHSGDRHVATYWRTVWKKKAGQWKLIEVVRLNATSGEEQDYFSS